MGLAASQARFLGITARKSNMEYEGQQVNQQRTALAEEVNSLYNKLLSLSLPLAPDATDFYETDYTFNVEGSKDYNGSYTIKNYYKNSDDVTYTVIAEKTTSKQAAVPDYRKGGDVGKREDGTLYITDVTEPEGIALQKATKMPEVINMINETLPAGQQPYSEDEQLYFYVNPTTKQVVYIPESQILNQDGSVKGQDFTEYGISTKEEKELVQFPDSKITLDGNGRLKSIQVFDPDNPQVPLFPTADIDATRVYDQEGYDAALKDYTMSKDEYDKKIADLNSQTESLQQEDKVLELRLNQIDTEQNELQTELEAVKAVLDKNIENTFNTFS